MVRTPSPLWPREHGAYAQLAVALLCGAALGHGSRGLCQAALTACLFLASEPVLVLLGRRGEAVRTSALVQAGLRLLVLGSLALLTALGAWLGAPASQLLGLLPPALLGAGLFGLFLARRERTAPGELVAAWAFSASAGSVTLLGGGGLRRATLLSLLLAGMFTLATAIVHCHLLGLKGRALARFGAFLLGGALVGGAWALARHGVLPRTGPLVLLPMALAALGVWAAPPEPRKMKAVGWLATACAVLGGGLAVLGLR